MKVHVQYCPFLGILNTCSSAMGLGDEKYDHKTSKWNYM
jgi:hypothetical protein